VKICYYCKRRTRPAPATGKVPLDASTRDHRIPASRGGKHVINNTVNACYACNQDKGALTEREYKEVLAYRDSQSQGRCRALVALKPRDPNVMEYTYSDHIFLYEMGVSCE